MDRLLRDIRYGVRQLGRHRGSSIVAIFTLALGIGASTAIFSVVDAAMLRPLPYPDPEQLVAVRVEIKQPDGRTSSPTTSMADVRLWQQATDVFSKVAGWGSAFGGRIVDGPEPQRIRVSQFTEDYLALHGVRPFIGRDFTREDTQFGAPVVALLGWVNESAARDLFPDGPAVRRQLVRAGGKDREPWTVLGVIADLRHGGPLAPRGENFPTRAVFFPLQATEYDVGQAMLAVLRPSTRIPALGDRLRQTAQSIGPRVLVERIQTANERFGASVITPRRRTVLLGLLGGLGLVLALVGIFGMTAYAVSRRTREIGVRMAFGALPAQVVIVIVRDAALPIVIGTALGLGAAALATRVIESFLFQTKPIEVVTFAAVAVVLVITGCLSALVPALRAARVDPVATLRAE